MKFKFNLSDYFKLIKHKNYSNYTNKKTNISTINKAGKSIKNNKSINQKSKENLKIVNKDKTTYEKSFFLKLSVSQLQSFYYQKYRLSLIALLLKNNLFITQKKYKVYHPFKYSIEIRNYKSNKEYEELNKSIMNLGKLKPGDFYLYEFKKFYFYLHFFNKELGKEIFAMIQKKQYEFNEVYEHLYYNDDEPTEAQMYKYLRDEPYMNYLLNGYDKKYTGDKKNLSKYKKKNSDDEEDEDSSVEDGFTIVKKKK